MHLVRLISPQRVRSSAKNRVNGFACPVVRVGPQVRVGVESLDRTGMPESRLHGLGRGRQDHPLPRRTARDRLLDDGVSEITDLIPMVGGLNKSLADMLVTSEYSARPRRWATGIELEEADVLDANGNPTGQTVEVNPIPEGNRAMISEDPAAKFGQLPSADMAAYRASVDVLLGQIMAVSALPSHYVGITTSNPASADALRASEASLTARAESRQATFGRSWEQVARLVVAVRTGADHDAVDVRVKWADAATRSVAQEADAVVKLFGAGLLPASVALARLGYTDDQITEIRTARRAEKLDGLDLGKLTA